MRSSRPGSGSAASPRPRSARSTPRPPSRAGPGRARRSGSPRGCCASEGTPIDDQRASAAYRAGDARHVAAQALRPASRASRRVRPVMSALSERPANPVVGEAIPHESASLHVTGLALYTDDLVGRTKDCLHAYPVQVFQAHATVTRLDPAPALEVPGVVRVLTAEDVPGVNDAGIKHDEPLFPTEVCYFGHPVAWVLAETLEAARLGAAAVVVEVESAARPRHRQGGHRGEELPGRRSRTWSAATSTPASRQAAHVFSGEFEFAGQEHFYLETNAALAHGRRERPDLRPEQHAAPVRDPGDHRPRPRAAQPRRHRPVPAHGRRLRRQGDAAARVCGDRGSRRDAHRAAGPAAAQPDPWT